MHEHRGVGFCRAGNIHAVLTVRPRDAAHREFGHDARGGVHGRDDLSAHAREGRLQLPHAVHQVLHLAHAGRDARHAVVHAEGPRVVLFHALVQEASVRAVAADHVERFAVHVIFKIFELHAKQYTSISALCE